MAAARLKRLGHSSDAIMHYTPRQMAGWLHYGELDRRHEMADQLVIGMNAARGDLRDVSKQIEDLRE
ncbi:hypothetical protein [Mesorhizobium sp. GbtcB19]|uniref:hypothetical protein n=1 Tax=Mesorhizobium sp. GbtcB19 TaxID=2824764 RepID=UPI001C2F8442|nr:hypothetical protein [Mesorhizobium sp. GbtcB19]